MRMVMVIALKDHIYKQRRARKGEIYEARLADIPILQALKIADQAPKEIPPPPAAQETKRRYRRRDMAAQE